MKKQYLLPLLGITAMAGFAFTRLGKTEIRYQAYVREHVKSASGAAAGNTGAPGESRCTSCHAGTAQNGDAVTSLTLKDQDGNIVKHYHYNYKQ